METPDVGRRSSMLLVALLVLSAGIVGVVIGHSGGRAMTPPDSWAAADLPPTTPQGERRTTVLGAEDDAPAITTTKVMPTILPLTASVPPAALERFVDDAFSDPASGWLVRTTARSDAAYVEERYQLTLTGDTAISVSSGIGLEQYRLSADVQVEAGQAGLVFASAKPTTFFRLLIDPAGTYAVEHQQAGATRYLVHWTPSAALIVGSGVANHLVVERHGQTIQFTANDQPLGDPLHLTPDGALSGNYGVALVSSAGQGRATFDNLVGERLPTP